MYQHKTVLSHDSEIKLRKTIKNTFRPPESIEYCKIKHAHARAKSAYNQLVGNGNVHNSARLPGMFCLFVWDVVHVVNGKLKLEAHILQVAWIPSMSGVGRQPPTVYWPPPVPSGLHAVIFVWIHWMYMLIFALPQSYIVRKVQIYAPKSFKLVFQPAQLDICYTYLCILSQLTTGTGRRTIGIDWNAPNK